MDVGGAWRGESIRLQPPWKDETWGKREEEEEEEKEEDLLSFIVQ